LAILALLPLAVAAQSTYRCTGKDGKKYYGSSVPPQCTGVVVEQLGASGTVVKRIDPQASADERAKKEAAEAERKKQALLAKEQARRDQALLATYASEKDVEDMRRRALEDNQRLAGQIETKIASLKERAAKGDAASGSELSMQEGLLETKKKEAQAINAKYDDDRKRYRELIEARKK
jgi:multidrug efflux pump subunit AcrA (membrane-fusion protein)